MLPAARSAAKSLKMDPQENATRIIEHNRGAIESACLSAAGLAALVYGTLGERPDVRDIAEAFVSQVEAAIRAGCDDDYNYAEVYDERELVYVRTHGLGQSATDDPDGPDLMLFDIGIELATEFLKCPHDLYERILEGRD